MAEMEPNSIDTIITDPPYALKFMGKSWDKVLPDKQIWVEALRVAKPGAFLLAFGGTRTFHRLTCDIEDAGWEIRDCLMWLYGSGFPKSLDISKAIDKMKGAERKVVGIHPQPAKEIYKGGELSKEVDITAPATPEAQLWNGWGTALKPAYEPIIVAMKPLNGTFANNALKWGVGGLNIDGGRIGTEGGTEKGSKPIGKSKGIYGEGLHGACEINKLNKGRFPANLILDKEAAEMLDEQSIEGGMHSAGKAIRGLAKTPKPKFGNFGTDECWRIGDSGGASRFFYCAKASKAERGKDNKHPTVKPVKLMEYLVKLTKTPTGGVVLDPFGGSGTTGKACKKLGRKCILIDKGLESCEIAAKRIDVIYRTDNSIKNKKKGLLF